MRWRLCHFWSLWRLSNRQPSTTSVMTKQSSCQPSVPAVILGSSIPGLDSQRVVLVANDLSCHVDLTAHRIHLKLTSAIVRDWCDGVSDLTERSWVFVGGRHLEVIRLIIMVQGLISSHFDTEPNDLDVRSINRHYYPRERNIVIIVMRLIQSQHLSYTERKCRHFDEILITGCTGSCHFDNFQCSQWWKFHQNEDISVSVYTLREVMSSRRGRSFLLTLSYAVTRYSSVQWEGTYMVLTLSW